MNLFKLMATLGLDDTEYKKKLDDAEKKTEGMGKAVSGVAGVIKKAAIPVLVGAIGKSAIDTGMDFESAMSQVAATMGMSAEEVRNGSESFENLKEAAREAGATTRFSATEGAEALNNLALAGYDSEKAIATLPKVLTLAQAGGIGLNEASAILTKSMNALGIETSQAGTIVDKMAVTAQKSGTTVAELGDGILTVGGTAKSLAGGVTEMNTVLGIFADAGIMASEGGTALRNVILAMTPTTATAKKAWEDLGIATYDADGKMRPLNETFSDLNAKLKTMTEEDRNKVLTTLFNKVDLKAVNALLKDSGARFDELAGFIDNSAGAGDKMAGTMNDNLQGALKTLSSTLDDLKIAIFNTFGESAKEFINAFATGIQKITKAFEEGKLDGVIAAIGAALAGVITYIALIKGYAIVTGIISLLNVLIPAITMVKSFAGAWAILSAAMSANPIGVIIMGIAALVAGFVYLWNTQEWFRDLWIGAWEAIKNAFSWAWDGIKAGWQAMVDWFGSLGEKLNEWKSKWLEAWQTIKDFFSGIWEWIKGQWNSLISWLGNLGNKIQEFKNNWVNRWNEIKENVSTTISNIVTFFGELPGKIWTKFLEVIQKAKDWVTQMATEGLNAGKGLLEKFWEGIKELPTKVFELGKQIPGMLWDGIQNMAGWLGDRVSGFVDKLIGKKSLSLDVNAQPFTAMNGYSLAAAGNGARMKGLSNKNSSSSMNLSLNIGGREFDRLVIKTVTDNYGKIENIIQSKERGRR